MRGLNLSLSRLELGVVGIPDAQSFADKWVTRTGAASQDYAQGVAQSGKDQAGLAIAAQARLLSNFQQAVQSGKWAQRLRAVGTQGYKDAVAAKGVANFQNGVQAARDKVAAAAAPLLAFESNLQRQVQGMPNVTDADREARMLAWTRGMRQYGG
jgi:hypothetical protein